MTRPARAMAPFPPLSDESPTPDAGEARLHWRVAIAMLAVGAVTLVGVLPAPDPDPSDHTVYLGTALLLAAAALGLWAAGPRHAGLVRSTPYLGILVISAVVAVARPVAAVPFFYLWPVLNAAYFFDRRRLAVALVVFAGTYAAGLAVNGAQEARLMYFIGSLMCVTLAAIVVNELRRNVDRLVAQLRRSAATDPLTGIPNRRAFEAALHRELERSARTGRPLTVAMIDVDHFKQVNDRFGHEAGDRALRVVADVLVSECRGSDLVARLGGEEFVALLVDTDAEGGRRFFERVSSSPRLAAAPGGPLTLSAGVAEAGGRLSTRDDLIVAADRALYAAKAAGRCRVAVWGEGVRRVAAG